MQTCTDQLKKLDPALWTKAHISTVPKADNIESNMSVCFNSWIINERYFPDSFINVLFMLLVKCTSILYL